MRLHQASFTIFITGMESVLEKTIRRKVVKQSLDLVQAGAHGDHGQGVQLPVGRGLRQESVLVKHNLQDLVY